MTKEEILRAAKKSACETWEAPRDRRAHEVGHGKGFIAGLEAALSCGVPLAALADFYDLIANARAALEEL